MYKETAKQKEERRNTMFRLKKAHELRAYSPRRRTPELKDEIRLELTLTNASKESFDAYIKKLAKRNKVKISNYDPTRPTTKGGMEKPKGKRSYGR